jgi:DNA-directed RNA polymerase subunit beta'
MEIQNEVGKRLPYYNDVINKRKLQDLMYQTFHNYGVVKSSLIADRVKNLTFHYATRSGISLNAEDLRVPYRKRQLMGLTSVEVEATEQKYGTGTITSVERFQKVIDIWNNASNTLKDDVLTYFRESDPLNPLYIMAFSGARGNISQVRQLVGMRGLMADPQGQIIDLPIKSNFREGLKVTEYVISSYGARKGLVDTALRTADSGYLTRRLVDVAQDIIVRDEDCLTSDHLSYDDLFKRYKTTISLKDRIIGRLLAQPVVTKDGKSVIGTSNAILTASLINEIENSDYKDIKVRSPLTCNSNRSVCRKCYGWHLSYSRIVDLGEAVGIVAAQSIGEPGTQLTMRTFHTGGVFSGDLTRQIRAPFSGTVFYSLNSQTKLVRTMHGEKGFRLNETVNLYIENSSGTRTLLKIPEGNILLVNHKQKVYASQILAEIKKDANLILEEDTKHVYTEVSGEAFFQNIEIDSVLDKQGSLNNVSRKAGLIWVLHGERYSLPKFSSLKVSVGQEVSKSNILAHHQILNTSAGIVKFEATPNGNLLKVLNFSLMLRNTKLTKQGNNISTLSIINDGIEKRFQLTVNEQDFLTNGQTIAVLDDDIYRTETGGIICYDISETKYVKKRRSTKKVFSGSLYWIPEETHVLNSSLLSSLLIKPDTIIPAGSELWPGSYSKLGGLIQLDDTTQELVIKSGELYALNNEQIKKKFEKSTFIKPGESICDNLIAEKLCYVEPIEVSGFAYLLVRPVQIFQVPREKGFLLEHRFFSADTGQSIKLKTVKRIFFKNWERVKSNQAVNLLQTFLVLQVKAKNANLQPQLEIVSSSDSITNFKVKVSLYEVFKPSEIATKYFKQNIFASTNYLVHENQFIYPNTVIAQLQVSSKISGTLIGINDKSTAVKDILILKGTDIKEIFWSSQEEVLKVHVGDLVRIGCSLTNLRKSNYSGQVYRITNNRILIRLGRPYLISEGTILRINPGNIVQRSDILATLVYEKLKTVDIVQGLPKVEEILEARKIKNPCLLAPCEGQIYLKNSVVEILANDSNTVSIPIDTKVKAKFMNGDFVQVATPLTDGQISPHDMLATLFAYYQTRLAINEACKLSFKYLQLFLVNEVQRTYLAQGVQIADKHIEVIVKQMTSKVRVEESGDTTLLPGEILSLYQAERITKAAQSAGDRPPFYIPILLGLTKASLNSDSFISAASFQETTRVLTEAAIEGKKDWLNGLKENVIIGRLIPAGTGFNCYEHLRKIRKNTLDTELVESINLRVIKENLLYSRANEVLSAD